MTVDVDMELHRVLRPDTRDGIEGDDRWDCGINIRGGLGGLLVERSDGGHLRRHVIVEVVSRLQIEGPLALVTMDIGLVTIVAEPLAAALQLFGRCEAMEGASRHSRWCW